MFAVLVLIQFLPQHTDDPEYRYYVIAAASIAEVIFLLFSAFSKKQSFLRDFGNILTVIYFFIGAWTILAPKTGILDPLIFPAPGKVLYQLAEDRELLGTNILSSIKTVFSGYIIALLVGIPMGVILGWFKQVRSTATYVINFCGSIPAIVFIPYAIALMPTFDMVSKFVIFISAYWPIMKGTIAGVSSVEKGTLDTARSLNIKTWSLLWHVVIPSTLPNIFAGAAQGLGISFLMLVSAEMIGGTSGLGYYVNYYAKFGNYTRVILGITILGIVICLISLVSSLLQKHVLRWKESA